ncbi:MAG: LPS export ABC transporter periplasmic protein LptC [Desulfomicrobium sp.]
MKRALLGLLAVAVLVGLALLGKQLLWPDRLDDLSVKNLDVDLSLKGVTLSQGKDGKKLWNLNATGADYAENGDELTLTDPVIVYWGEEGGEPLQVRAPKGQVWQKEDRARMWDGVHGVQGRYVMHSQTLDYAGRDRTLVLGGTVELTGESMRGRSDTLTYFLDTGDFLAQGNVQVIMN